MKKIFLIILLCFLVAFSITSYQWLSDYKELRSGEKPSGKLLNRPILNSEIRHDILTRRALLEKPQTASRTLQKSTEIGGKRLRSIAHFNLAMFYIKSKNYQTALKEFEEALKLDPTNYKARYNWELLQRALKKKKKGKGKKKKGKGKKKKTKSLQRGKGGGSEGGSGW